MDRGTASLFSVVSITLLCLFAHASAASTPRLVSEAEAPVVELWSAQFLRSDAAAPPPASARWRNVELPDRWRDPERYEQGLIGWYRFSLPDGIVPAPDRLAAAYLWRFNMTVEVWFNGVFVASTGQFEEPVSRNWNRPLLVDLPASAWRSRNNVLDVRLRAYPHYGALAPVFVGGKAPLEQAWRLRSFLQNDLSLGLFVLTVTLAGIGFAMWAPRRDEQLYLLFALASLAYSVFSLNLVVRDVPVEGETWWWIANAAIDWWAILLVLFGIRLMGDRMPRIETGLVAYAVMATVVQAAVDLPTFAIICNFFHLLSLICCVGVLVLITRRWVQTRRQDLLAFALGIAWICLLACHDLLMNAVVKVEMWRYGFFVLNLGAPLVFVAMAWHLIRRYADALADAERANASLEERVADARTELDASYAAQRRLELAKVAGDERERIYRDLHDDVGARLLSLVYAAPDEPSKSLARDALRQLRELVAGFGTQACLASELAEGLASEIEERAVAAGLTCSRNLEVRADVELSAVEAWHVTRILREAVSNALRHSMCHTLRFRFLLSEDGALEMSLADDGCGIAGIAARGSGLRNMSERAAQLGGLLELGGAEGEGVVVTLRLALAGRVVPA